MNRGLAGYRLLKSNDFIQSGSYCREKSNCIFSARDGSWVVSAFSFRAVDNNCIRGSDSIEPSARSIRSSAAATSNSLARISKNSRSKISLAFILIPVLILLL